MLSVAHALLPFPFLFLSQIVLVPPEKQTTCTHIKFVWVHGKSYFLVATMIQAPLIYPASNSVYWTGCLAIVLAGISTNRDCFRIAKLSTDHMCSFHVEACLAHCSKLALVSKFYSSFIPCFTSHQSDFTTIVTCIFKVATMKLVHNYTVVTNNQQWSAWPRSLQLAITLTRKS